MMVKNLLIFAAFASALVGALYLADTMGWIDVSQWVAWLRNRAPY